MTELSSGCAWKPERRSRLCSSGSFVSSNQGRAVGRLRACREAVACLLLVQQAVATATARPIRFGCSQIMRALMPRCRK